MGSRHRCGDSRKGGSVGGVIAQEDAMYHPAVTEELARLRRLDLRQQPDRLRLAKGRDVDRVRSLRKRT